jgi:hypothetical protein
MKTRFNLLILVLLLIIVPQWSCAGDSNSANAHGKKTSSDAKSKSGFKSGLKNILKTIRKADKKVSGRAKKNQACRKKCDSLIHNTEESLKCVKKCME